MLIPYIFSVINFVQSTDIAKTRVLNKRNRPGDLIPADTMLYIQGLIILFYLWKKDRVMSDTSFT